MAAKKKKSAKKAGKKAAKPASKKPKAATTKPAKKPAKKKPAKVSWLAPGYHEAMASMNQVDASATIEFAKQVFGAKLRMSMPGAPGKLMHAEITIGKSVIMLSDSVMEPARVSAIFVYVPDVDKVMAKAVELGSTVLMPAMDMPWGDRFGRFADPFGNLWGVGTHIEEVPPKEMAKRMKAEAARMAAAASDGASAEAAPN